MKDFRNGFRSLLLVFFVIGSWQLFAQETKTLDGEKYTVIDPVTYAFNADTGTMKKGQKYVIDGVVLTTSGSTLTLNDVGLMNSFTLNSPLKLEYGTKVTLWVELTNVNTSIMKYAEAKIIKIEGPGVPKQTQASSGTITLDGVKYNVITPVEYAFNADSGKMKVGERYVIDGEVLSISGATLNLIDVGIMNSFTLSSPTKLNYGTKVRVYAEITVSNTSIMNYAEAKIIKLENR
jgi:hypothetical protein